MSGSSWINLVALILVGLALIRARTACRPAPAIGKRRHSR